jgi:hypothetical protein
LGQKPQWDQRYVLLNDLSPFATFLCRCFNSCLPASTFDASARRLISRSRQDLSWVYETEAGPGSRKASVNYWLWTDALFCECGTEVLFWQPRCPSEIPDAVSAAMRCPRCDAHFTKSSAKHVTTTYYDDILRKTITQNKQEMILIDYIQDGRSAKKLPGDFDTELLQRIADGPLEHPFPNERMMHRGTNWGDMYRAGYHFGITHAHHFWTRRSLLVLSDLMSKAKAAVTPHEMLFLCTSFAVKTASRMHNVGIKDGRINLAGQAYNTLQLTSISAERNIYTLAEGKIADLRPVFDLKKTWGTTIVTTGSATRLADIPSATVAYVFIDPRFGDNIIYSEMSFLYEGWLRVFTNQEPEAIISGEQGKLLADYQSLMFKAFRELFRVVKPGCWLTVAFHNSKNAVWNAIQEALGMAGLVVADVRVLDKGQGTYKQMTTLGAVKKDLVISAYKPSLWLEDKFALYPQNVANVWEFIKGHLRQLPVFVSNGPTVGEAVAERQKYLLFDRMVAFHIQRGVAVPLSASEFYSGLARRYPERDGMYFLPEQVTQYDEKRSRVTTMEQFELFVSDEKTAIQWVRRLLSDKPMKKQDIQPIFMQEAQRVWEKHEQPLELQTILEQNFIEDRGGVWRVPDEKKEADLEQMRHRALMKEFQQYLDTKGKLKVVRTEALRAGFKECWRRQKYEIIVQISKRVLDIVIQEDPALLMYYDNSLVRTGE